jgi:putative transposase
LFAALDVAATGTVLTQCKQATSSPLGVSFVAQANIDANVPQKLSVHLIIDNYCTPKHAKVK